MQTHLGGVNINAFMLEHSHDIDPRFGDCFPEKPELGRQSQKDQTCGSSRRREQRDA